MTQERALDPGKAYVVDVRPVRSVVETAAVTAHVFEALRCAAPSVSADAVASATMWLVDRMRSDVFVIRGVVVASKGGAA